MVLAIYVNQVSETFLRFSLLNKKLKKPFNYNRNVDNFQLHGAPLPINGMNFSTDLEPDIVGCDRFEQIVKLVSNVS